MRLDCECGFVARGAGGNELVAVAQAHARDAHLVDLTAEVILALGQPDRDILPGSGSGADARMPTPE